MLFNKNKKIALYLTLFLFVFSFYTQVVFAEATIRNLYDSYQSAYAKYQEAIDNKVDAAVLIKLAEELAVAKSNYYSVSNSQKSEGQTLSQPQAAFQPQTTSTQITSSFAVAKTGRSTSFHREQLDQILAKIAQPDRLIDKKQIQNELLDFIKNCPEADLIKEATFELANLTLEIDGSSESAIKILTDYARSTNNTELHKEIIAQLNLIEQKAVVEQLRKEFETIRLSTINSWQSFASKSWLAIPVKVWSLATYSVTNIKRTITGARLLEALDNLDKAVLATYPTESAEFLTRSKVIPLNNVKLLVNGRQSFHYRLEHAKRALHSIYLQTLLYQDDIIGNNLADILIERAQNGVDVRLILDDFFSFNKKSGVIQRLRNAGVQVMINNPILKNIFKANFRSHQKLFVVDESVAIIGGMNIGDEYATGEITEWGWRDTDVEVKGTIVTDILALFKRNWEELTIRAWNETGTNKAGKDAHTNINEFKRLKNVEKLIRGPLPVYFAIPPAFENVNARFVVTAPISEKDDNILDLFEIYLGQAKQSVIFQSAYFIPPARLIRAIKDATARGVSVKIITNSIESNNHPYASWAGRDDYAEVLTAGAQIYEWQGAQTLHSKVSLFDNFAVTVGAYNVNTRSHTTDSEDLISFEDYNVAAAFREMLEKDLLRTREVTLQEVRQWNKSFTKRSKIEFFKLFKFMF